MKQILFNTAMVSAVLDGRKTCTRRKPFHIPGNPTFKGLYRDDSQKLLAVFDCGDGTHKMQYAPYEPGDVLYVRERWKCPTGHRCGHDVKILFECADDYMKVQLPDLETFDKWRKWMEKPGWIPSIHMPKAAARIFLRVTGIRVERLHDISMSGIRAEGVVPLLVTGGTIHQWLYEYFIPVWNSTVKRSEMERFGWPGNPWVWVIEFERIGKEDAET